MTIYSTNCPYCESENITMIWDPEYNDMWSCDDCRETFGTFILKSIWDDTVKYINLKDEISSLPSLDSKIDTLQKYWIDMSWRIDANERVKEYIRIDDLLELFKKSV